MRTARMGLFVSLLTLPVLVAQEESPSVGSAVCRVRARICDEEGKPIANAGVVVGAPGTVTTTDALQRPQARSDENGSLSIDVPIPAGPLQSISVLIAAPGRVTIVCPDPQRGGSWRRQRRDADLGELRLPKGPSLTGRVCDADGQPVAGAKVDAFDGLARYWWLGPCYRSLATSGANGVFTLPGVFSRALRLEVAADGFHCCTFESVELGAPLDIRLQPSGFVEGSVVDAEGKPVLGRVRLTAERVRATYESTSVASDWRFRASLCTAGRYRVTAYSDSGSVLGESDVLEGPQTDLVIRCAADDGERLVVRAVDAVTGAPVRAVRAAVIWYRGERDENVDAWLEASLAPARPDGAVSLDPPGNGAAGPGVLLVAAAGYAPFFADKVDGAARTFEAKLVASSRITGRVIDAATEQPVAGALVTVDRKAARDGGSVRPRGASSARTMTTSGNGSFTFDGLGADDYVVEARHATGSVVARRFVTVEPGEHPSASDLVLAAGITLRGRVEGAAVGADWRVVLSPQPATERDDGDPLGGLCVAANVDGSVPIVDGAFEMPHRAVGTEHLSLVVPAAPRRGAALVIPLTSFRFEATDVDAKIDLAGHLPGIVNVQLAVSGAKVPMGRFAVAAIEADRVSNQGRPVSETTRWVLVEPDGKCELRLPPGTFHLAVVDSATGIELFEEKVDVASGGAAAWHAKFDACQVSVRLDGGESAAVTAWRLGWMPADAQPFSVRAAFGGGTWGAPGADVVALDVPITLWVPPGEMDLRLDGAASTIRRGSVRFAHRQATSVRVTAEPGRVNEVTLTMPPRQDLDGK
ncbi:MAG: carboxypeptidase regulatory-like domain-containing protein [Planctomycetes bacterium]|nr:carboxypeptidase regulatory-like domain-containing protein [Planctomycetota bacterium]